MEEYYMTFEDLIIGEVFICELGMFMKVTPLYEEDGTKVNAICMYDNGDWRPGEGRSIWDDEPVAIWGVNKKHICG